MPAIFLIGARAAGKTTLGGLLAARLGLPFFDCDALLLEKSGLTVAEIVAREGWPGFRRRESELLRDLTAGLEAGEKGAFSRVIATGGGVVLDAANRALLRACGLVFFLKAPAKVLAARLLAAPEAAQRPSLSTLAPQREIAAILRERAPLYREAARHTIDAARPPAEVLEQMLKFLGKGGG